MKLSRGTQRSLKYKKEISKKAHEQACRSAAYNLDEYQE
jgi:hypothetical protein